MGGGDQEMARPARRIAHLQVQNRCLGVRLLRGFLEDRVQGRVEKACDERGRSVVAAGRLAFVAAGRFQGESDRVGVEPWLKFEK